MIDEWSRFIGRNWHYYAQENQYNLDVCLQLYAIILLW